MVRSDFSLQSSTEHEYCVSDDSDSMNLYHFLGTKVRLYLPVRDHANKDAIESIRRGVAMS